LEAQVSRQPCGFYRLRDCGLGDDPSANRRVATLRKTLVVFATLIGVTLLGEPHRAQRALALLVILAGVVAVRLG
jgi:hypothetical protein